MDVNVTVSNSSPHKESLANSVSRPVGNQVDSRPNAANVGLSAEDVQKSVDNVRTTEQVNATTRVDAEELNKAVNDITESMSMMQKGLAFKVDEDLGIQVVKVIDVSTGELIRQMPNEEALEIAKKLNEVTGLLMKTEV
ncbi:flagellar protein FlaG [Shewanella sp. BF02_Schw]|uniref:flagellar protein FlaG n=1 Tax=Shewanella sp. BF02_Schw TaxID=394908 RepID=UPI00177A938D|nr:flagellar protein FlaG [Shewanella sp. BF02_Schw]MBO1894726.1 flagellar protein FlaG [Shewanella sp. BF02_Schw]